MQGNCSCPKCSFTRGSEVEFQLWYKVRLEKDNFSKKVLDQIPSVVYLRQSIISAGDHQVLSIRTSEPKQALKELSGPCALDNGLFVKPLYSTFIYANQEVGS